MRSTLLRVFPIAVALLGTGLLKADLVALGSINGTAVITVPAYYITLGAGEACSPPFGPSPTMYTCQSNSTMDSLEGYTSALSTSATTVPGTLYVGGAQGNVTGKITTDLEAPSGCTINGVPMTTGCANYFTFVQFQYQIGPDGTCASVGGCIPYEPYVVQALGDITYGPQTLFGGPPDSPTQVTFEYTTPEPAFFLPLALGLGVTGLALRKKALARHL
jgi:hypothetical protein